MYSASLLSEHTIQLDLHKHHLATFKEHGYLTEDEYKEKSFDVGRIMQGFANGNPAAQFDDVLSFNLNLLRMLHRNPNNANPKHCLVEIRCLRNFVCRLIIFKHIEFNEPFERVRTLVFQLEEVNNIGHEWNALSDGDESIFLKELQLFLSFENLLVQYLLDDKSSSSCENHELIIEQYEEFRKLPTYASVFALIGDMIKIHNIDFLPNIEEDYKRFENNPFLFHVRACLEVSPIFKIINPSDETLRKTREVKSRLKKALAIYHEGAKTADKLELWNMCLDNAENVKIRTNKTPWVADGAFFWVKAATSSLSAGCLSKKHVIELLDKTEKESSYKTTVELAINSYPHEADFHCRFLTLHLMDCRRDLNSVLLVFRRSIQCLQHLQDVDGLYKVFITLLEYLMINDPQLTENIFLIGILLRADLAAKLLINYLKWLLLTEGVNACHKMLDKPYIQHATWEFYDILLRAEKNCPEPNQRAIRNCYEVATRNLPHMEEVWLDYTKYELLMGDSTKIPDLYARAMHNLRDSEKVLFKKLYKKSKNFRSLIPSTYILNFL